MASPTDRLLAQLNQTQLAQKDNPTYQVIKQLIQRIKELESLTGTGGGGSSSTVINNVFHQFLSSDDSGGGDGGETLLINNSNSDEGGGMVPYFIALNDIFTVPEFKQALFQMTIDVEGILEVDGFLIQVD